MEFGKLTLSSWRPGQGEPRCETPGVTLLRAEIDWKVEGPGELVDEVAEALPGYCFKPTPGLLQLSFGNSVGYFDVPHLGRIEVRSGKWGPGHFQRMLLDISSIAAALPFSAGSGSALPFDRSVPAERDVLYHAFVYLRHILFEAEGATNLERAFNIVLADPHQRLVKRDRRVPPGDARSVSPRAVYELISGQGRMSRAGPAADTPLATALNGWIPEKVWEQHAHRHFDTPENRFALAFLGQVLWIIEQMDRLVCRDGRDDPFIRRVQTDCARMVRALRPIRGHRFWRDISPMVTVPESSMVLQRRRGYSEIFQHFSKLRLASLVPLSPRHAQRLLEAKDIATLYELWCYFKVVDAVREVVGAPSRAESVTYDAFTAAVRHEYRVEWPDGLRVVYNPRFSRYETGHRSSYSVPLRPDIAVMVPREGGVVAHLLDAKFKLQTLGDLGGDGPDDDDPDASPGAATFKRGDLYKMHTYRDAIPAARTVWILYPGTEKRFFGLGFERDAALHPSSRGVGAVPLRPEDGGQAALVGVVGDLLRGRKSGARLEAAAERHPRRSEC